MPPVSPTFTDVPTSHPLYTEIAWLASSGIADGFPDGTFRPGGQITRQAASAFFYRVDGEPLFIPPGSGETTTGSSSLPFTRRSGGLCP